MYFRNIKLLTSLRAQVLSCIAKETEIAFNFVNVKNDLDSLV